MTSGIQGEYKINHIILIFRGLRKKGKRNIQHTKRIPKKSQTLSKAHRKPKEIPRQKHKRIIRTRENPNTNGRRRIRIQRGN